VLPRWQDGIATSRDHHPHGAVDARLSSVLHRGRSIRNQGRKLHRGQSPRMAAGSIASCRRPEGGQTRIVSVQRWRMVPRHSLRPVVADQRDAPRSVPAILERKRSEAQYGYRSVDPGFKSRYPATSDTARSPAPIAARCFC
jgi:hypothetical protein